MHVAVAILVVVLLPLKSALFVVKCTTNWEKERFVRSVVYGCIALPLLLEAFKQLERVGMHPLFNVPMLVALVLAVLAEMYQQHRMN